MTSDEQVGKNLAKFRGELSQKDLADAMRKRGFKWSQATVWSVEKGERPLRLIEAEAIEDILGRVSGDLLSGDQEADLFELARRIRENRAPIRPILAKDEYLRLQMAILLDRMPEEGRTNRVESISSWVESPIEDVIAEHRREREAEDRVEMLLSGTTDDELSAAHAKQAGTWLDRYNRAEGLINSGEHEPEG